MYLLSCNFQVFRLWTKIFVDELIRPYEGLHYSTPCIHHDNSTVISVRQNTPSLILRVLIMAACVVKRTTWYVVEGFLIAEEVIRTYDGATLNCTTRKVFGYQNNGKVDQRWPFISPCKGTRRSSLPTCYLFDSVIMLPPGMIRDLSFARCGGIISRIFNGTTQTYFTCTYITCTDTRYHILSMRQTTQFITGLRFYLGPRGRTISLFCCTAWVFVGVTFLGGDSRLSHSGGMSSRIQRYRIIQNISVYTNNCIW